MGQLANIARNVSGVGGVKIALNDLIAKYPEYVTITGAFTFEFKDKITQKVKVCKCFNYAEDPDKYFYAESGDLPKIFDGWLQFCNGNIDELNEKLTYEKIKLKIYKKPIGGGKKYTKACVVDVEEVTELVDMETGEILG